MSRQTSIDLKLRRGQDANLVSVIWALLSAGWSYFDEYGQTTMLPIGDDGEFNWVFEKVSMQMLAEIVAAKEGSSELVGLNLYWKSDEPVICLLAESAYELGFVVQAGRKVLCPDSRDSFTDFSWYLSRIAEVLRDAGLDVEAIEATEF